MESAAYERMKRFFSPEHIAVVGASTRNFWFRNIKDNADRCGFPGRFYPVNPTAREVNGIKAFSAVKDLPDGIIDYAVVIVKSTLVHAALKELSEKGIRNVLLISSGFAEMGGEGAARQEQINRFCAENDIWLMGPNCLGYMNLPDRVNVFAGGSVEGDFLAGNIALVGQSGASSEIIATKLMKRYLGISLYAATGNESILTSEDIMEYLVNDGRTRVITGFMEGFRNLSKLKEVALHAARKGIPIILLKVGRSEKGVHAARSHTGALAGNDEVMDGFLRQYGIIRVETIEELVETAAIFSRCRLPEGNGLGICTLSGGLCGLYADLCARYGIELPRLSDRTISSLKAILPEIAQPDNPLDMTGSGFSEGMGAILKVMLEDDSIKIIVSLSFPPAGSEDGMPILFNDTFIPLAAGSSKPVIPITFREVSDYARKYYHDHGLYFIEHVEDGFKAVSHLIRYAAHQKKLGRRDQGM